MRPADAIAIALLLAVTVTALLHNFGPPTPRYYPLDHTWKMAKEPGAVTMAWYGHSASSLGGGAVAGLIAFVLLRLRRPRNIALPGPAIAGIAVCMVAVLMLTLASVVWNQWHWFTGAPGSH